MRKLAIICTILLTITLCGCSVPANEKTPQPTASEAQQPAATPSPSPAPTPEPTPSRVAIGWKFVHTVETEYEYPYTEVSILVTDQETTEYKLGKYMGQASAMDQENYERNGIPAEALLAEMSWYAGAGDYTYVVKDGDRALVVMYRCVDEQAEIPPYQQTMTISVSNTKNIELLPPEEVGLE